MKKELKDKVWNILPKEFKEEVKKMYNGYQPKKIRECLIMLFGIHNLASNAEGEEMLIVSRKRIQRFLDTCKERDERGAYYGLLTIFGSKCFPDKNEQILSNVEKTGKNFNVDSLGSNVDSLVPKYKVGDKVVCLNYPDVWRQVTGIMEDGTYVLDNCIYDIKDSDIVPYTETSDDKHNIIDCNKKKALLFYEHLLDLVENSGINKNFTEWCNLESEYIALFGEEIFKEHYKNILSQNSTENCDNENTISICENKESYIKTCTGEKLEDHTAQDLEMVNSNNESLVSKKMRLEIAVKMAQAILSNPNDEMVGLNGKSIVDLAITITDALIAECKK